MKDDVLIQLAVSFGLGLLLGLQRERTERSIAGIRTFPLIALFGTICAHLAQGFGGWILASGLISLAGLVVWANVAKFKAGDVDTGITTEVTALLIFALGAYIAAGHMGAAVVVGGAVALVLHYKKPMHAFADAIGERDMRAIMLFVFLTLVILPVLPHAHFGPYGVWNAFDIWLMVVLMVAISLSGYVAYKLLGAKVGTLLGGILGGLISSTATTLSYARRTASAPPNRSARRAGHHDRVMRFRGARPRGNRSCRTAFLFAARSAARGHARHVCDYCRRALFFQPA